MKSLRLVVMAMLLALPFARAANAQVAVGIGVGPEVVAAPEDYGPPAYEWGYYNVLPLCLCTLWLLRATVFYRRHLHGCWPLVWMGLETWMVWRLRISRWLWISRRLRISWRICRPCTLSCDTSRFCWRSGGYVGGGRGGYVGWWTRRVMSAVDARGYSGGGHVPAAVADTRIERSAAAASYGRRRRTRRWWTPLIDKT